MNDKMKISGFGLRVGYLYDLASVEDKVVIDKVLKKYEKEYPLMLLIDKRNGPEPAPTPEEAKKLQEDFDKFQKQRKATKAEAKYHL